MTITTAGTQETHDFGAEVGRLLDLVVHSLYSEREIFLRELVANAADATDRRRFEAITNSAIGSPEHARVRITPDKDSRTLTIADDGIGMSREELIANLGTIAKSGSRAFSESVANASADQRPALIGQFGVGFYAAFMVADRVEVTSRHAGQEEAHLWASEGRGNFTIAPATREDPGTSIVLYMKEDADDYLDPWKLEQTVRRWADHVTIPVVISREGDEDIAANEGTALWRKGKADVTDEQVKEFYHHVAHAFDDPYATLHWRAEGQLEFYAMMFIPGSRPFDPNDGDRESHLRLHVKRMFITDKAKLLPDWLRFVQGVVDTEDLPLNVSREMLQATPVLARIRRAVTGKVLGELKNRAKDSENYAPFWKNFGPILKEGFWDETENKADLAALMRFRSSNGEEQVSFSEYITRMQPGQDKIYYLLGDDPARLAASPQLEGFKSRNLEVLLLSDPVDAFWPERLTEFEGKKLISITKAGDLPGGEKPDTPHGFDALCSSISEALGAEVGAVRASQRLTESAVALAAPEHGPDLQVQRMMRRMGRDMPSVPVLELNPGHDLIKNLCAKLAAGGKVDEAAHVLLDLARVQDGEQPADPAAFARRVAAALSHAL
jgi:molecular chaperone HtpG